jgi:hypothetical protein
MHSPFGPFYVTPLQQSIDHAERLVRVLEALDHDIHDGLFRDSFFDDFGGPQDRARGSAIWIVGRAQEVEAFVADVAHDWRQRRISAVAAASVLERYLDALHGGMRDAFDLARPACCAPPRVTAVEDAIPSEGTAQISVTRGAMTPSRLGLRNGTEAAVTPRVT